MTTTLGALADGPESRFVREMRLRTSGATAVDDTDSSPAQTACLVSIRGEDEYPRRTLQVVRSVESALAEAAQHLQALQRGVLYAARSVIRVDAAQVKRDPRHPCTGLHRFDDAARNVGFVIGAAQTSTQHSAIVRPHSQTTCERYYGYTFEPGELRQYDLSTFEPGRRFHQSPGIPALVLTAIAARPEKRLVLYKVFHTQTTGMLDVHGWVLTADDGSHIMSVDKVAGGWARPSLTSTTVLIHARQAYTLSTLPGTTQNLLHIEEGQVRYADKRLLTPGVSR